MRLPRSLRLGPHRYRVIVDHDGLMEGDKVGSSNADRLVIALSPDLAPSAQADTLLHETIHALLTTVKLDEDIAENVCLALSPGLLAALRDNPPLVDFLLHSR